MKGTRNPHHREHEEQSNYNHQREKFEFKRSEFHVHLQNAEIYLVDGVSPFPRRVKSMVAVLARASLRHPECVRRGDFLVWPGAQGDGRRRR